MGGVTLDLALLLREAVQAAGYRCDTLDAARPCLVGCGYLLNCNGYRYTFEVTDRGGRIEVEATR
jgi:hypothetical protein